MTFNFLFRIWFFCIFINKINSSINRSYVSIEANPKAVFLIKDSNDLNNIEYLHEIGDTGVLHLSNLTNIKELKFLGFRQNDGSIKDKIYLKTVINEKGE